MTNRRALAALVRKDLLEFVGDRRALLMTIAAPVLLASFMAIAFGGAGGGGSDEPATFDLRVADEDGSGLSRRIVAALAADEAIALKAVTQAEARDDVRRGRAVVAVVIPPGFGDAAARALFGPGSKPELGLLYDPTKQAELAMARGMLTQHVMQAVSAAAFAPDSRALADREAEIGASTGMRPELRDSLLSMFREIRRAQAAADADAKAEGDGRDSPGFGMGVPFATREEVVTAGGGRVRQRQAVSAHAFGGMAVQFILFAAVDAGVGLLNERRRGVWKRFRAAPLSRTTLLAARVISMALIALAVTAIVFGFGAAVFGIRIQGGPAGLLGFLAVACANALMAAAFGLLVAAAANSPQAARGVAILAVLMMVMLGGGWFPTQFFPAWIRSVTPLIPTRWAIDGFDAATIRANSAAEMLGPAAALLGFAALFGVLAVARFRWEAD